MVLKGWVPREEGALSPRFPQIKSEGDTQPHAALEKCSGDRFLLSGKT